MKTTGTAFSVALCAIGLHAATASLPMRLPQLYAQEARQTVGAIKTTEGTTITLTPDSGADVSVSVAEATRIVRIAPGEKSLKNATPIQFSDLQVGDRILVGGKPSEDAKSVVASSIVVMKRSDVEARKEHDLQDWQKRGLGGLVSAVDPATGTVTISTSGLGGTKTVLIRTSRDTVIRRYAPDSVRFDDAKPSTLQDIHRDDQLRARGNRSADGAELTAEEIVSGTFHNVAGLLTSVDARAGSIIVQDVFTKKPVQITVTAESQLRKLPPELAQHMAMRLKGDSARGQPGNAGTPPSGSPNSESGGATRQGLTAAGGAPGGTSNGARWSGAPDFQQMLNRMPAVSVSDLHKGDAVMIVTTQGTGSTGGTAITLLSGVEPILEADPNASQAMMLTPWTLGGPSGDSGN